MAKDIIFKEKPPLSPPRLALNNKHFGGSFSGILERAHQLFDRVQVYDRNQYVRGIITSMIFSENVWNYCVRPDYDLEKKIWSNDLI